MRMHDSSETGPVARVVYVYVRAEMYNERYN